MNKIKDGSGMDPTEAEDIKRGGKIAQKNYINNMPELHKKGSDDLDNHSGVVTHLKPDILKCEVKWALRSITMNKASGGDRILVQ